MDNAKKIVISLSVISVLSVMLIAAGLIIVRMNSSHVEAFLTETYPSTMTLIDLKFNIKNIQYWLTNISATRAKKGYDEGFQKAWYHYRKSRELLTVLLEQNRGNPEIYGKIKKIDEGLEGYYEAAVATANAYIESGTGYGNEMLRVISAETESITGSLDALVDQRRSDLDGSVHDLSLRVSLFQVFFLAGVFIIVVLTFLVIFSRNIIGSVRRQSIELQSTYEELQSTYEELVAANEEYEAQNEDLVISQAELVEKEQRFRSMLEQLPLPVLLLEGNRIIFVNRMFEEKFGYSRDDFETSDEMMRKLYPDEEYRRSLSDLYQRKVNTLEENTTFHVPLHRLRTRRNEDLEVETEISRFAGITIVTSHDMTDLKKAQKMLIQTEKLTTIGTLAAGMAHEINNPLGIIMQGVQTMRSRLSFENEKSREIASELDLNLDNLNRFLVKRNIFRYMEAISDAVNRASKIIFNMLQFSRKGAGEKHEADINAILERSIELVGSDYNVNLKYDFRLIKIEKKLRRDIPRVLCHETEIEQVFVNLLKNAAQALDSVIGDERKPGIELETGITGSSVFIRISDNGQGMDENVRDHVFEPFYTTKQVGSGTGLGLAVSYYIITESHNGSISVESLPGEGTSFTIVLPVS